MWNSSLTVSARNIGRFNRLLYWWSSTTTYSHAPEVGHHGLATLVAIGRRHGVRETADRQANRGGGRHACGHRLVPQHHVARPRGR